MASRKQTARLAGVLYLVMGVLAVVNLIYFPSTFIVRGDSAATAARIAAAPLLYRLCIVSDLMSGVASIYMALTFYQLFRDVDRPQARVLVGMVFVQVPMYFAIVLTQLAPLVLLSGAGYWSALEKSQLDALSLGFLGIRSQGLGVLSVYWGIWLLPLGILVYKSKFIPRILGVFLIVAACAYVVSASTYFLFPAYHSLVFWLGSPLYGLGELSIMVWLLVKGAREDVVS